MATTSISNPASFRAEAQFQRVCAVCGNPGEFDAHHVVAKQTLKKRGLVHRLYDPRNALRLCDRCHAEETACTLKVDTSELTDDNICFVWEVLKEAGQNYLERHYTGVERRYTLHAEGRCPRCQLPK
jgi:hypothetical protein